MWSANILFPSVILFDDTAQRIQVATLSIVPTANETVVCKTLVHSIRGFKVPAVSVTPSPILRINEGFGCQPKDSPAYHRIRTLDPKDLRLAQIVPYMVTRSSVISYEGESVLGSRSSHLGT